jgi:DNA processing protein
VIDHPFYFPLLCHRLPGIQQRQLRSLLHPDDEMVLLSEEQQSLLRKPDAKLLQQIDNDLAWMEDKGVQLLRYNDADYPSILLEIADPPPLLYVLGDAKLLASPQLAIVGSRRPSRGGCEHAYRFARELAQSGWVITSGMALGIDGEAHRGALDAKGKTIAVLGTGLDLPYPHRHRDLYQQIAEQGVVISEWPLGSPPIAGHFPRRNRIISGLSLGVLVVESALQSGSLVTARLALEQNREVFAIPGSIHNPSVKGCHQLIRQGAKLVEEIAHIQEELSGWLAPTYPEYIGKTEYGAPVSLSPSERQLLQQIGFEPVSSDELIMGNTMSIGDLLADITNLIAKGLIEECEGRYWRLR